MSKAKMHSKNGVQRIVADDGTEWKRSLDGPDWVRSDDDSFYVLEKRVRCPEKGVEDTGWYFTEDREHGMIDEWCATLLLDAVDVATGLIRKSQEHWT